MERAAAKDSRVYRVSERQLAEIEASIRAVETCDAAMVLDAGQHLRAMAHRWRSEILPRFFGPTDVELLGTLCECIDRTGANLERMALSIAPTPRMPS